jgi:hypothetical protein
LVWGGAELARFTVYERGLVVEPLIEVPAGSPHLLNTLVLKVLNEYRREDELAALRGGLRYGERLSYTVAEEEGLERALACVYCAAPFARCQNLPLYSNPNCSNSIFKL